MAIHRSAIALLGAAIVAGCSGGGGGGCVIVNPTPDLDFMIFKGIDAADMDGDGLTDLVYSSRLVYGTDPAAKECGGIVPADGSVTVRLQDMSNPGTFLEPMRFPVATGLPNALELADLNGDAFPDVIVTNRFESDRLQVFGNAWQTTGELGSAVAYPTVFEPHRIGVGDVNLDGRIDLVIAGSENVVWHPRQPTGGYDQRNTIGDAFSTLALADFDADGVLEVATSVSDPKDSVLVYDQEPGNPGVFNLLQTVLTNSTSWTMNAGDLNEDGWPDIVAAGIEADNQFDLEDVWYRVLQSSQAPLAFAVRLPRLKASNNLTAAPIVADLNGDQREDVVFGGGEITVFLQTATPGEFGQPTVYRLPPGQLFTKRGIDGLAVADLNGDVLPDIATSNGEVFALFQNPGSPGTFGDPVLVSTFEP
jgi:hypothetical protein